MRILIAAITITLLTAGGPARADFSRGEDYEGTASPDRYAQRAKYLDALHLIRTNQFSKYNTSKGALRTYALYPYLEYTEHAYRISRKSEDDILAFAEQYADTPLVEPLTQHWLTNLAKGGDWQTFLKNYDRVSPNKLLACYQGYALFREGDVAAAMQAAEDLWLVDYSQPDECDPAFKAWRDRDGLTPELAWQRFALAIKSNERKLAGYLIRFLDKSDKPYASNFRLVQSKPHTIKRTKSFSRNHPRNHEIILHGVQRLSRSDPEDALATLGRYQAKHDFDPDALEEAYANIGIFLALKSDKPELSENLPVNLHNHPKLLEAQIRQSLRFEDWSNVMVLINLLPEELKTSPRWRYWQARVLAGSDDIADRQSATATFEELSQERTFYGFLSADLLAGRYSYEDEPIAVTQEQVLALEQTPGIERALELFALGERSRARREWYFTTSDFSLSEQQAAARVALRWGWYKAAIQTMIDAEAWNHLDERFPIAYQDRFVSHARRANIPVQWSLAIARQESAFMPDAKSSAGALGLMQLMPSTAKLVAGRIGVSYANNRELTEPDLNIRLGTNYLAQMLRQFDNNRIIASAAYNAGPGNVGRWLKHSDVPFDVWIEIIPFAETRGYVQNVLMFSSIYSRKMNETAPLVYPHERSAFKEEQIVLQMKQSDAPAGDGDAG